MSCNCSGLRKNGTKLVPTYKGTTDTLMLVQGSTAAAVDKAKNGLGFGLVERFYDKCVSYNIRYCPLRRGTRRDKVLGRALSDIFVLACFFIANFVVLLNILSKIIVNVYNILNATVFFVRPRYVMITTGYLWTSLVSFQYLLWFDEWCDFHKFIRLDSNKSQVSKYFKVRDTET